MTQTLNPLKQFFRQPAIYIRLPSGGEFWPQGALELPQNGELPVYPMTAMDEITYRTPDALFNGQAVINVIQSCIPNIKNAWHIPHVDLNAILVAIRMASYGNKIEIASTCPSCQHSDEYQLDLQNVLDNVQVPDYANTAKYGDLEVMFKPMSYEEQNQNNSVQFEQQQLIRNIPASDLADEEKLRRMADVMKRIAELTVIAMRDSIAGIRTPTAFVTEPSHIEEFLNNCDRQMFTTIRDKVIELKQTSELKPVKLECQECHHQYEQSLTLDMTSFFGDAS